jgi:hypothetical protein
MQHHDKIVAGRKLAKFICDFTRLLNMQLEAIRIEMQKTTESVMQNVSQIPENQSLDAILIKMMGNLSNDDVMSQRMEHVVKAIRLLQKSISRVLADPEANLRSSEVHFLCNHVLHQVLKDYTMESEKKCFKSVFETENQGTLRKVS